nr:hypothetical protein CFP56_04601 [Quercus suber]
MTSDQPLLDAIMQVSDGPDVDTALLACISCKQRKSKCDKLLPRCSSCIRRKRTCEYARLPKRDVSPPSVHVVDRLRHSSRSHEDHGPVQTIDLPTMLFLDPNIISHGQVETVQNPVRIPDHILALIGDFGDIVVVVSKAIEHIDPWMPFISKKRFFDLHLTTSFHNRADVVLLSLALKLIATLPLPGVRNPRTPLYNAIKQFYLEVETSSILSIQVLQAGVLIALYELGHGIYPAAFLSIGACARYAHVMGLGFRGGTSVNKVLTLLEFEERRRVWWAIVILDRFVSIGCPGRPFATADPKLSDILPVNDEAWAEGVILPGDSVTLSSPLSGHMSRFALLCQATSLLGQVLVHVANESGSDEETSAQLDRTLQAMVSASLEVAEPDNDQIAFVYRSVRA